MDLDGGRVHVSAVPVDAGDHRLGFVVLLQDMTYADLRAETSRRFTLAAFGILAVAASLATALATRFSWRNWTSDLRRILRGKAPSRAFQPIVRDVRDLAEQIASESLSEGRGVAWTADRLGDSTARNLGRVSLNPIVHVDPIGTILFPLLAIVAGVTCTARRSSSSPIASRISMTAAPTGRSGSCIRRAVW